jgi:hypothetical protein
MTEYALTLGGLESRIRVLEISDARREEHVTDIRADILRLEKTVNRAANVGIMVAIAFLSLAGTVIGAFITG